DWQQAAYSPVNRERIARYETRIAAYEPAPGARMPRTRVSAPRRRPRRARRPRPVSRGRLAIRRIVAVAAFLLVAVSGISYGRAMLAPSNVSFGVRTVEWLRDHGAAWLVSDIERIYYSANAPQKGGPPLKSLPNVARQGGGSVAAYAPAAIKPLI